MAFSNPDDDAIKAMLGCPLTIAVAICSPDPRRDSYRIAGRLQSFGFRVIPVNPFAAGEHIHGERCYARIADIPEPVDMVDVFRRSPLVQPIVDDAIASGVRIVWMQLGVINETAAQQAQDAGLMVVMDRCTSREYRRLFPTPAL